MIGVSTGFMVGQGLKQKSALARCSIIDYSGKVVMDTFVKPRHPVVDYRTKYSGIRPHNLHGAPPLHIVQGRVKDLLRGSLLVGHSVMHDISVLEINAKDLDIVIRDTAHHVEIRKRCSLDEQKLPSLKTLAKRVLKKDIQSGEHSSVEDAQVTNHMFNLYYFCVCVCVC